MRQSITHKPPPRRTFVPRGGFFVVLSMMCYKVRKYLFRGKPVERTRGKTVIVSVPDGELFLEISKGKELVWSIGIFVILAVAAFHLAVVPGV